MSKSKMMIMLIGVWLGMMTAMFICSDQQIRRTWYCMIRGDSLITSEPVVKFKAMKNGEVRTASFSITNRTSKPIKIVGQKPSCSCAVVTKEFPIMIEPHNTRTLEIEVRSLKRSDDINESIIFYSDAPDIGMIQFRVMATITKS